MEAGGRCWWVYHHGPGVAVQFATVTRMDGLLLGAACALVVRQFRISLAAAARLFWLAVLPVAGYVAGFQLLGFAQRQVFKQSVGYTILAVGFAVLVLYSVLTDGRPSWQQAGLCSNPLRLLGKYSYGIYVLHVPIFYFLNQLARHLPSSVRQAVWLDYLLAIVKFVTAFGVASLSYDFFEKRFLAMKDRFAPAYRVTPVAAPRGEMLTASAP
jgi:peptidoglycan/LPS O-acetylase OafA/YrhL